MATRIRAEAALSAELSFFLRATDVSAHDLCVALARLLEECLATDPSWDGVVEGVEPSAVLRPSPHAVRVLGRTVGPGAAPVQADLVEYPEVSTLALLDPARQYVFGVRLPAPDGQTARA